MGDPETPKPAPAGWYPDPDQPQTQRYWDGGQWTDQRAPAEQSSSAIPLALIVAVVGAVIAVVGTFLPQVESDRFFKIADNTMLQSGYGWVVIGLAAAGAFGAYLDRAKKRSAAAMVCGVLVIGVAIYAGTGDRLELTSATPGVFNQLNIDAPKDTGTPGVGVYAVGLGGALMLLSGLLSESAWRRGGS